VGRRASGLDPAVLRVADGTGGGIEVEVWELTAAGFGSLVAAVPAPLAVGTVTLEDGSGNPRRMATVTQSR